MTIDYIMTLINSGKSNELLPVAHKSLSFISEEPFYVATNFSQISSKRNARFILVSAPGATGKSAFGKYIAHKKNALYWNLAEISLGDGSFYGTLYKSLGATKISGYAADLQNGEASLVIDAFDEAEIISGRKNVETFLFEANEFLENATKPSIVLLSRTETAQNMAVFFRDNDIPFVHLEIGYFPKSNAKEFVLKTIEKKKAITSALETCVDEYFNQVVDLVNDKEIIDRFLGYAPVLEAIAKHISEISNTAKLLSELNENATEVSLIKKIMDNLLEREHQKVVDAFKERIKEGAKDISDFDSIYSKKEQLVRVLNYILLNETSIENYSTLGIPQHYIEDYAEMVNIFLPQHPFVQSTFKNEEKGKIDFSGPAFRDYCLACLFLEKEYEDSAELYYQSNESEAHFPSQLFWNHYIDSNDGCIKSRHFPYLIEAYKSKTSAGSQAFLDLYQDSEEAAVTFRIEKDGVIVDNETLDVEVGDNKFVFGNLNNASINVCETVIIGQNENVNITNSTILCNKLIINSGSLKVDGYEPCMTIISSKEPVELRRVPTNIYQSSSSNIQIDIPNIYELPKLSKYKVSFSESDDSDILTFAHHLRCIFSNFRTHKKDMPAKDAEKIDYIVVAGNESKKDILQFLKDKEIIFKDGHLYKINLERMSENKISWGALITTNTKQLETVHERFIEWKSK